MADTLLFKMVLTCRNCDEDIISGVYASTLTSGGYPLIPADIAEQETFDCMECGATNYTGELDVESEGGSDPDEGDEADDEGGE